MKLSKRKGIIKAYKKHISELIKLNHLQALQKQELVKMNQFQEKIYNSKINDYENTIKTLMENLR